MRSNDGKTRPEEGGERTRRGRQLEGLIQRASLLDASMVVPCRWLGSYQL